MVDHWFRIDHAHTRLSPGAVIACSPCPLLQTTRIALCPLRRYASDSHFGYRRLVTEH